MEFSQVPPQLMQLHKSLFLPVALVSVASAEFTLLAICSAITSGDFRTIHSVCSRLLPSSMVMSLNPSSVLISQLIPSISLVIVCMFGFEICRANSVNDEILWH
jgi:hypothetical protein